MARIIWLCLIWLLSYGYCNAQDTSIAQIMERGMAEYDDTRYELALIEYRKALALEPKNAFVNYETALAYYQLGNDQQAMKYAKIASKDNSESGIQGVVLLGTLYDEMGKSKKSIKTYKKSFKRFGDYYLLWYNLGVTYNSAGDYEKAAEAFMQSVNNRLDHANSHYALASMMQLQGRRAEALLPLYFYLLLLPDADNSAQAATTIFDLWSLGVSSGENGGININVSADIDDSPMGSAELIISMAQARWVNSDSLDFVGKETEKARTLFNVLDELDFKKRDDFYTQYYIPLFGKIANSEYLKTMVYYAMQSKDEAAQQWVNDNTAELEAFFTWLDEND